MHQFRGRLIAWPSLLLAVALLASYPSLTYAAAETCGVWRWSIKTLSDADASQVNFVPVARTISQLRRRKEPAELKKDTPRTSPLEFTVYRVRARLVEYKREKDRDLHVVIASPTRSNRTMVAEVVDPTCPGASDSPRANTLKTVRQEFIDVFGQPVASFKNVPSQPVVFLIGVGFWDSCTPGHIPRGAAPKCVEIHPVLDVEPLP